MGDTCYSAPSASTFDPTTGISSGNVNFTGASPINLSSSAAPALASVPSGSFGGGGSAAGPTFATDTGIAPPRLNTGSPTIGAAQIGTGADTAFNPITGAYGTPNVSDFAAGFAGGPTGAPVSSVPAGMDPIAAANFAAESGTNPAGMATVQQVLATPGVNVPLTAGGMTTAAPATAAPTGAPSIGDFFHDPVAAAERIPLSTIAGTALSAGGLIYGLANQPKMPNVSTTTGALNQQASELAAQGQQLTDALTSGNLPAGAQASVDQAVKSAQATIRSHYASMGLSGSSQEAEALSQAEMQGPQIAFQIAQQMATTGVSELGLSANIYNSIITNVLRQDQNLQAALSNFAAAAAGGGQAYRLTAA